jgi:hypothetical protein
MAFCLSRLHLLRITTSDSRLLSTCHNSFVVLYILENDFTDRVVHSFTEIDDVSSEGAEQDSTNLDILSSQWLRDNTI